MRYISLLLVTFIFASCGNQKMRFVRTQTTKQKVVEVAEIPSIKKKSETISVSEEKAEELQPETEYTITANGESDQSTEEITLIEEISTTHFPKSVEDSTTISPQEVKDITQEALKAERDGSLSLLFSILFYAFVIMSFIFLLVALVGEGSAVGVIGAILFSLLSIVSLILGFVFGVKSLRARFTTPKGKRRAVTGVILSGIAIFLLLLNVAVGLF